MFQWLSKWRKAPIDQNEEMIKSLFGFLIDDYGFQFEKGEFRTAVDKDGNFFFHGPLNAYYIYHSNICINILYLVQRQDYQVYITDRYQPDQVYIRNGTLVPDRLAYDLKQFADEVKTSLLNDHRILGKTIE